MPFHLLPSEDPGDEACALVATYLEVLSDGCLALDDQWRLTYVNRKAVDLLENKLRTPHDLSGTKIWEAYPTLVGSSFEQACRHAMAHQMPVSCETWYPPLNRWLAVDTHPFGHGILVYCRDITVYKRMEEPPTQTKDELDARVKQQACMIRRVNAQLLALIARHKTVVEKFRAQVHQQMALAVLSQRALAGLEPQKLMDQAVALVAREFAVADSEVRELLVGGRGVEIYGDDHTAQTWGTPGTQQRTFTGKDSNFLRAVASLLAQAIQRKHLEDRWQGASQQMQDLARHLLEVQEAERRHLAQAIYDDLGQTIIGLQLDVAWLAQRLKGVPVAWRRHLESMAILLDELLNAVYHIGTELRPRILDDLGLQAAIESQLQEALHRTGIASEVSWPSEDLHLDKARALAVFRIFQEALTNVLRHAKASRIMVRARQQRGAFSLEVSDNGKGIVPAQVTHGTSLGLLGMRERAQLWGGEVTIHSTPREGTTVVVRLPYTASEEEEVVDDPHRDRR